MIEDEITRTTHHHLQTFGPKSESGSGEEKNNRFIGFFPYLRRDGLLPNPEPEAGGSLVAAKLGAVNVPKP